MAGMIKNIFGLDTQDVLKKRAERNRLLAAQRIKQGDIDPTVAILGQQFGDMLGRGLMKKLGYEDPEMSRARLAEELDKDIRDKLDSGELDPASKDYNMLMADYYGKLGDIKNQTTQLNVYRVKENTEFQKNATIATAARGIINTNPAISQEEFITQLKSMFPSQKLDRYKNFVADSDIFGDGNNTNNEIQNYNPSKKYNINDKAIINGVEYTKVEGGWEQKSKEKEDTEKEKLLKTLDSRIENSMEKLKKLFN